LSSMRNLVPYLHKRNYNFYKIEIVVNYTEQFENIKFLIEYKDNNENWISRRRTVLNGNPISVEVR